MVSLHTASPQGMTPEMVLAEAQIEMVHGRQASGTVLSDLLELIARDSSLPPASRAQALALLCRLG